MMKRFPLFVFSAVLFLTWPTWLWAQAVASEASLLPPPASSAINLFDLILKGGWAMYPLALLLLLLFVLIFHCWQQTSKGRFVPESALSEIGQVFGRGDPVVAKQAVSIHNTMVTRLLTLSLAKARPRAIDFNRPAMDQAFIDAAEGEENAVGQWINYLNVIATVAPMVGLLGTVSGMIGAFQKIGTAGLGKPEELAGNIGEALITTASGLVIGIPAMIAYFYFRNRLSTRMLAVGQTGGLLMDCLTEQEANEEG